MVSELKECLLVWFINLYAHVPWENAPQILPSVQAVGWSKEFLNGPHWMLPKWFCTSLNMYLKLDMNKITNIFA